MIITVDEAGTEAAAATVVRMIVGASLHSAPPPPPPFQISFDHPFVFSVLRDNVPLFSGILEAPPELLGK